MNQRLPHNTVGALRKSARGFSFIELMFVLVILGVLFAVALPKLTGGSTMPALRTTAANMARLGVYARQQAISLGEPVVLSFHVEEQAWYLTLPPRDKKDKSAMRDWQRREFPDLDERPEPTDEERTFYLNSRILFDEFLLNGETVDEEVFRIWFYPNGTSQNAMIVLKTKENNEEDVSRITVGVESATAVVTAYEGEPKNFADELEAAGIDSSNYEGVSPSIREADEEVKSGRAFGVTAGSRSERESVYQDAAARIMGRKAREFQKTKEAQENGTGVFNNRAVLP
ncbi:MAG: Tfp pilus assembly protein FimT/FimU [Sumerlaeia bacterium]